MVRSERGIVLSDIAHIIMCVDSGIKLMKSKKVSCAVAACLGEAGQRESMDALPELPSAKSLRLSRGLG